MSRLGMYLGMGTLMGLSLAQMDRDANADVLEQLNQPGITYDIAKEEQAESPLEDVDVRLHSTNRFLEGGDIVHDNLIRVGYKGFEVGYERDGEGDSFGVKMPVGELADLHLLGHNGEGDEEKEAIISIKQPFEDYNLGVVARAFDSKRGDGFGAGVSYRKDKDITAKDNMGAGIAYTRMGGEDDVGGYGWFISERLGDLFAGAGRYLDGYMLIVGVPNKGGPAWRFFRIDNDNGFQRNELLFTTEGECLSAIDSIETIHGGIPDQTDSVLSNGVFTYRPPAISGRGRGWTGGVVHTEIPGVGDTLDVELVRYFGGRFVGLRYSGNLDDYGDGTLTLPIGFVLGDGGDGLTRNYFRIGPFRNFGTGDYGIEVMLERIF